MRYRSYDPFGDDDGNGKPDKRKGRESEELAVTVNDDDPDTAWLTSQYAIARPRRQGGRRPRPRPRRSPGTSSRSSLNLVGAGSGIDVRVADRI